MCWQWHYALRSDGTYFGAWFGFNLAARGANRSRRQSSCGFAMTPPTVRNTK
ncbi:hypothetical protein HMPREF0424_0419 [Gardnerella vaginalis 409-05]|nr:hypothetical protein HMPREF0424_0419 [Gardnerella vaginalis 409-05]